MDHKNGTGNTRAKIVTKNGVRAVKLSGWDLSANESFAYGSLCKLEGVNRVKVQPGTTLTFEVCAVNKLGRYVGIDLDFEGGNLRDSGALDQNGLRIHPAWPKSETTGEWVTVTCDLSERCLGRVIKDIRIAYDHPENKGAFSAYIRNISIQTPGEEKGTTHA